MRNFKAVKRDAGYKIYEQDGDGRQWRNVDAYGSYKRKGGAMAMVYKLRAKEKKAPCNVGMRICASRVFCKGVM